MLPDLTFVNILTTGPDESADQIVEYAAVRVKAGETAETFARLARVRSPLSHQMRKRTGLRPGDLKKCASTSKVLGEFLDFVSHATLVCWDADHLVRFLDAKGRRKFRQAPLDVWQFATIVLPSAPSYGLGPLAERFGLDAPETDRALPALELTRKLWQCLCEHAETLSVPVVSEIARVLRTVDDPLSAVFSALERKVIAKSLGTRKTRLEDCAKDFSQIIRAKPKQRRPRDKALDQEEVARFFEPDGVLGKTHENYERRQEQTDMARAVCRAFSSSSHLMVEAGTGTGKSMAYLVPSILWSRQNDVPVVVSTNTKNLQEQLFFKDIPYLQENLGQSFEPALIKGRGNYVCVRRLLYLVRECERELSEDERVALLPLIAWFDVTDTGDLSECSGFLAGSCPGLRPRLTTRAEECAGRACRHFESCFIRRARALALAGDIVVANHAVVFAELGMDSPVLPPYEHIIFDEAHNLEDVATEFLARRVSRLRIVRILNRLYRPTRQGGTGLLPTVLAKVRMANKLPKAAVKAIDAACVDAFEKVVASADEADKFFGMFASLFDEPATKEKVRFQAGRRNKETWEPIAQGKRTLMATTAELAKLLDQIRAALADAGHDRLDSGAQFTNDLKAAVDMLREVFTDLEFVLRAKEPDNVYWVERQSWGQEQYEVCAAPLEIASLMAKRLYSQKRSIIMSSATLTVADEFDFVKQRLGADALGPNELRTVAVGSPFDFDLQALVAVPNFLPDPGSPNEEFEDGLTDLLIDLFRVTQGRGLVLFTSYAMLNHTYDRLRTELGHDGILVLGQGKDGERSHLASIFRENTSSVLLGTQSFWEGVDFVGEALSCLVVVKLPFAVFTDPLIEARCEHIKSQGQDPFMGYSVPSAAIKFRQGFGRLIRTKTDLGVVVATDKRIVTRRYGQHFLRSLPTRHKLYADSASMLDDIERFLAARPQ